ncbi:hypothetical protein J437_LFUL000045 [Ladona fulva]|uniref:Uncharacterized protein n=1 Tax=Ladona fulva TaxID=123851 RepID=A0A8K0NWZ8_LADFU|nr:hypothetical protein J437_LFUL000045 [Ladona fulva]
MAMHWLSRGASGRRSRSRAGGGGGGRGPLLLLHLLHSALLLLAQWPAAGEAGLNRRTSQAHGGTLPSAYPPSLTVSPSTHQRHPQRTGAHAHSAEEASEDSGDSSAASSLAGPPSTADLEEEGMLPRVGSYVPSNCSSCRMRQEVRNLSLQNIKEEILNKLGMKIVPNITGRALPKIPRLHLLEVHGMQGDDPLSGGVNIFRPGPVILDEEDDFHARTERVIAFAQPREYALQYGPSGASPRGRLFL